MNSDISNPSELDLLHVVQGELLGCVTFRPSYCELRFDGLNVRIWTPFAVLASDGRRVASTEANFKNILCDSIGHSVSDARRGDASLDIAMQNGTTIRIPSQESADEPAATYTLEPTSYRRRK